MHQTEVPKCVPVTDPVDTDSVLRSQIELLRTTLPGDHICRHRISAKVSCKVCGFTHTHTPLLPLCSEAEQHKFGLDQRNIFLAVDWLNLYGFGKLCFSFSIRASSAGNEKSTVVNLGLFPLFTLT